MGEVHKLLLLAKDESEREGKHLDNREFFAAIPKKNWDRATTFNLEEEDFSHGLERCTPQRFEQLDLGTIDDLREALEWMAEGSPEDMRWIIMHFEAEDESEYHASLLQAGIFDDGMISCEYQFARREDELWSCKNFWQDFEPDEIEEVEALFYYCYTHNQLRKKMSEWEPMVIPYNNG